MIAEERNSFDQQNQLVHHARDSEKSQERQFLKTRNRQTELNKQVQDEDAFYKILAYGSNVERLRRENKEAVDGNPNIYANFVNFNEFYLENLMERAKLKPAEIDYEALKPKSRIHLEEIG